MSFGQAAATFAANALSNASRPLPGLEFVLSESATKALQDTQALQAQQNLLALQSAVEQAGETKRQQIAALAEQDIWNSRLALEREALRARQRENRLRLAGEGITRLFAAPSSAVSAADPLALMEAFEGFAGRMSQVRGNRSAASDALLANALKSLDGSSLQQ